MFRPLGDRVLIRPDVPPEVTETGLVLVRDWQPEQTGTVVALGTAIDARTTTVLSQLAVGDYVVFSPMAGQELVIDDGRERLLVMKATDVLAVLEGT